MRELVYPLIAVALLLLWVFSALYAFLENTTLVHKKFNKLANEPTNQILVVALSGVLITAISYFILHGINAWVDLLSNFLSNAITEFVSIAITVLILERLYARRAALQEKGRIIRQMASHSNDFALDAVRQIRESGWHKEGSLCEITLSGANLQDAELHGASLQGTNFYYANLKGADLTEANLEGATLAYANLENAFLVLANLKGADLAGATLEGAILSYAKLQGATYTEETTWPEKFDPKVAGAILTKWGEEKRDWIPIED